MGTDQTLGRDHESGFDSEDGELTDRGDGSRIAAARPPKALKRSCNNCRQQKVYLTITSEKFASSSSDKFSSAVMSFSLHLSLVRGVSG